MSKILRKQGELEKLAKELLKKNKVSKRLYNSMMRVSNLKHTTHAKVDEWIGIANDLMNAKKKANTKKEAGLTKLPKYYQVNFKLYKHVSTVQKMKDEEPDFIKPATWLEFQGSYWRPEMNMLRVITLPVRKYEMLPFTDVDGKNILEMESGDLIDWLDVHLPNSTNKKEVIDSLSAAAISSAFVLEEISKVEIGKKPAEKIPAPKIINMRDASNGKDKRMSHSLLTYVINDKANKFEDIFKFNDYYRESSCVASALLNQYKARWDKDAGRNNKLTYQLIHKICMPDEKFDESKPMPMNWAHVVKFFEKIRRCVYMYDVKGNCVASFVPKQLNKSFRDFHFICAAEHMFPIVSCDAKRLSKITSVYESMKLSSNPNFKYKPMNVDGFIENLDGLVPYMQTNDKDNEKSITLVYKGDLNEALDELMHVHNYIPNISLDGFKNVQSISIHVEGIKYIHLKKPQISTHVVNNVEYASDMEITLYVELRNALMNVFASPLIKSDYSNSFHTTVINNYGVPLSCKFEEFSGEVAALDISKAYPAALCDMKKVPVFSSYDEFKKYKGEPLEPYNIYYVRAEMPDKIPYKIIFDETKTVLYGRVLMELDEQSYKIIAVCKPHRLVESKFKDAIYSHFNGRALNEKQLKQIVNECIGKISQDRKTVRKTFLCANQDDADRMSYECLMNGDGVPEDTQVIGFGTEKKDAKGVSTYDRCAYTFSISKEVTYANGFLPVKLWVYNMTKLRMARLADDVIKQGVKVLGMKTDSLYIPVEDVTKLNYPEAKDFDGSNPANIGNVKIERGKVLPTKMFKFELSSDVFQTVNEKPIKVQEFKDEYSCEELYEAVQKHGRVMVWGAAGCGKSTLCKMLADKFAAEYKSVAFTCPTNTVAGNLRKEGYEAFTNFKLLGQRLTRDGDSESYTSAKKCDILIIEEGLMNTVSQWKALQNFWEQNPDMLVVCNGDPLQLAPIESEFNESINAVEYYTNIINKNFKTQYECIIPKRYSTPEMVERAYEMRSDIFEKMMKLADIVQKYAKPMDLKDIPNDAVVICYTNEARDKINKMMHMKLYPDKPLYFEGLKVCAKSGSGSGTDRMHKNYEYIIEKIDEEKKNVTYLEPLDGSKHVRHIDTLGNMAHTHANTCHSQQGNTIRNRPLVICEWDFKLVSNRWTYVALTRNVDLDNVFYCTEPHTSFRISQTEVSKRIAIAISGYKAQDKKKGFTYDEALYIDEEWWYKTKDVCFRCKANISVCALAGDQTLATIHRLNNDLPHVRTNVVKCCHRCNSSLK